MNQDITLTWGGKKSSMKKILIKINLEWMFDIVASHHFSLIYFKKIYESLETKHHIMIIRNAKARSKKQQRIV